MKKKGILLAYGIPWAFLMLYGDAVFGWSWQYGAAVICMAVIAWLAAGTDRQLLVGNSISLAGSLLCVFVLGWGDQGGYFKPFGAFGWAIGLALLSFLVQWLTVKKQWLILLLLAGTVGAFAGALYWLQAS